jgi:hypothetical protein
MITHSIRFEAMRLPPASQEVKSPSDAAQARYAGRLSSLVGARLASFYAGIGEPVVGQELHRLGDRRRRMSAHPSRRVASLR